MNITGICIHLILILHLIRHLPTERLYTVTENCIHFLQSSNRFGHYPLETQNIENIGVKQKQVMCMERFGTNVVLMN
jgi:hypothetical protein